MIKPALCRALCILSIFGLESAALAQQTQLQKPAFESDKQLKKLKVDAFIPQVGHGRTLSDIAVSADGKLLASASGLDDGLVKVWDVASGQLLQTVGGEDYVSFSADGKYLATGNVGGPVLIWEVGSYKLLHKLKGAGPVHFTADGKYLVGEAVDDKDGANGKLQLWSMPAFEPQAPLDGHKASWTALTASADGRFVATSSYDETIKVWDLEKRELARTLKAHAWVPQALALSPDGESLAVSYSGQGKATLELWDVSASKIEKTLSGHAKDIVSMHFSPDGKTLASTDLSAKTKLWDVATAQAVATLPGGGIVRFLPGGQRLAHGDKAIALVNLSDKKVQKSFDANGGEMFDVVFSADGKRFISTDATRTLDHWDAQKGTLIKSVTIPNGTKEEPLGELILSPKGTSAVLRPFSGTTLTIFDALTGEQRKKIEVPNASALRHVSFAPSEQELIIESVAGKEDEQTQFVWWDLNEDKPLSKTSIEGYVRVHGFVDGGKNVALVSNGTASGDARLSIKIWERDNGLLKSVKVKGIAPYSGDVAFCQSSPYIALGDQDYSIKLFDRDKGEVVATLNKHDELVNTIQCSPDGKTLVTSSWDEQVKVWSLPEGKLLMSIDDASYKAQGMAISQDGKQLLIAHKGWVRQVHLPSGHWRNFFRVGEQGWLAHDSHGRFECAQQGCVKALYRGKDATLKRADEDKAINKGLRALKPLP